MGYRHEYRNIPVGMKVSYLLFRRNIIHTPQVLKEETSGCQCLILNRTNHPSEPAMQVLDSSDQNAADQDQFGLSRHSRIVIYLHNDIMGNRVRNGLTLKRHVQIADGSVPLTNVLGKSRGLGA